MEKNKFYVTVCKNTILSNIKNNTNKPPIRISKGKYGKPKYKHKYKIPFNSTVVYSPTKPLPWGAKVWIEFEETFI